MHLDVVVTLLEWTDKWLQPPAIDQLDDVPNRSVLILR